MKSRIANARPTSLVRGNACWSQASCSLFVVACLGVLGLAFPNAVFAQTSGNVASNALPVLRGVVSGQAVVNASARGAARSLMTIDQASQRSIIDWRSFNIGSDSEVLFRHLKGSTASTLNRIYGADPSVIRGRLGSTGPVVDGKATAGGQVILINQNGILFQRGTQVNTQSLLASTLNLSNERYQSGALTAGGLKTAAFEGGYDDTGSSLAARPDGSRPGRIVLGGPAAATAAAPSLQANAGGSIMLFAPSIDNNGGIIRAPDGQVILAAGNKVYLALNDDANDITLRGFVVEVEAVQDGPNLNLTNLIRNAGDIGADRGNVSLAALAVNQEGRISAKTAVQSNGSIFLKARARVALPADAPAGTPTTKAGSVNFRAGSVTEVVPDAADTSTVPDSQSYLQYRGVIEASGGTINNSGTVRAAGGRIALNASDTAQPERARVYLADGSETSVAGTVTDVDFKKNLQTFRVTSNELKNSPDQKSGVLRGATVTVDLRQDNDILELDGYRAIVPRTVAEKAAAGGELQIASSGSVIQRSGATIDASGGVYRYGSGSATTTKLLGEDGKIYDIATAPEQRRYTQLLDRYERFDARWGQSISIANPLGAVSTFQDAYTEGLRGGVVTIRSAAGLVLDGVLKGGVTVGPRQMAEAPRGATLRIGEFIAAQAGFAASQRIGNITWEQQASDTLGASFRASTALTAAQRDEVTLASAQVFGISRQTADGLVESAFGTVELNANGRIVVPSGVRVASGIGGELVLRTPQADLAGDIYLPGGRLTIKPVVPQTDPVSPELVTNAERVIVRSGAELSTAGAWINTSRVDGSFVGDALPSGRLDASGSKASRAIDGGSITIQIDSPIHQTRLERGAVLDVGGGAAIDSRKRVTGGKGGALAIANGVTNQATSDWLQADLRGFAVGTGGELSLSLARAEISADDANGVLPSNTTRLNAGLFSDRGFSKVSVTASDGIDIVAGTDIHVQQKNLVVDQLEATKLRTGGDLASISRRAVLPDALRGAASIALNARASGVPGTAVLTLNDAASIRTDARGEVSLSAVNGLSIEGRISAPGGKVGITLAGPASLDTPDLRIGSDASISTAGVFVPTPNDRGLVQGTVVNGGSVTIDARNTGLRIDAGSRIDVRGVSQTVDVATSGDRPTFARRAIDGHAGSVILKTQGLTVLDGALLGRGGSAQAAGGSFALESRRPDGQTILPAERRIVVTPGRNSVPSETGLVDATINIDELTAAGFEKLRLQSENRISFQGSSTLAFERGIRLDAPLIDVADGARVALRGSTVSLGQSLGARQRVAGADVPTWQITDGTASPVLETRLGSGALNVNAGVVDLYGSLVVNGTSVVRVESDSDIRLVGRPVNFTSQTGGQAFSRQIGSLASAGSLEFEAAQVYPATRTEFTVTVESPLADPLSDGARILVTSNGNAPGHVYSAGGKLVLDAPRIVQAGLLKAPLGEIDLRASSTLDLMAGSVTSVSSDGLTVPYGTTLSGILWRYVDGNSPASTLSAVTDGGKRITLDAPSIGVRRGATVDLSGGGKVLAVEFVPGNGGDNDVTLQDNTFAIIPTARLAALPFDLHTQSLKDPGFGFSVGNGRDTALYDSISIGAGGAVPAGEYALLPARYALLADAYLVELQTGSSFRNLQDGQRTTLSNGDVVLAGFRTARGTTVRESQSVGVVLSPVSAVRQASDYNLNGAEFFAAAATLNRRAAPRAPWDAGRLLIQGATTLTMAGAFKTAAALSPANSLGRVAEADIDGGRIAVVDRLADPTVAAGFLQIEGSSLSRLNASVLLGGTRRDTDSGIAIATRATSVLVKNTSAGALTVPELMLAAKETIDVRAASVLAASGTVSTSSPEVIQSEASGALVRLSQGAQTRIDRGGIASDATGEVRIASGASLTAGKSLLIDATRSTESQGQLRVGGAAGVGGSLSLASGRVSLGDTASAAGTLAGLVLSNSDLAAFSSLDEFVLRGYESIDVIGSTSLGSTNLIKLALDTPLLRGRPTGDGRLAQATVAARTLELRNSSNINAVAATDSGTLTAQADRIVLGAGAKALSGFTSARFAASDTLASQGTGSLQAAATLTLEAPRVVALSGSNQTVRAVDTSAPDAPVFKPLTLAGATPSAGETAATATELGGRLTLEGQRVTIATAVQASSGQIAMTARGPDVNDGVTLSSGASLDARGRVKNFNGTLVAADGGAVSLSATTGSVVVQNGAAVDVSAAVEGGSAGRLAVRGAELVLAGSLLGQAAGGARSGSVDIDLATLADFSVLNSALNAGGFAQERQLRLRSGDIAVAALDNVAARRVTISADAGRIDVAGTIGTGAATGGARVNLYAGTGVTLAAGSQILAGGRNAGARGGEVRVAANSGALVFDSTATIDVRAGDSGPAGSLIFGVARDASDVLGVTRLEGKVLRWNAELESQRTAATELYRLLNKQPALEPLLEAGSVSVLAALADGAGEAYQSYVGLEQRFPLVFTEYLQRRGSGETPTEVSTSVFMRELAGVDIEATRTYNVEAISSEGIAAFANDHATFAAAAAVSAPAIVGALRDETGALARARVLGATEVRTSGDLSLDAAWDLTGEQWLAGGNPGTLTLRAGGNLTVSQSLGSPNDDLLSGDTWNLRLAAGADLAAVNPLTTLRPEEIVMGSGSLTLSGADAKLRTGTGRIDLAAGNDVAIDAVEAAIYTAGAIGARDTASSGRNRWAIDGGGISIRSGGEIAGAGGTTGDLWINEWLRRPLHGASSFASLQPTDWWSFRPRFQQGVGTLGGGDIDILAGGTISNLAVMLPTSGRTYADAQGLRQLDVQGGGNLNVLAGGDVKGSSFLVARGEGRIEAAGDIGAHRGTQLYAMGASSGNVPARANIDLIAGGSLSLQSINNPTAMFVTGVEFSFDDENALTDPSFFGLAPGNSFSTYFTYSANSRTGAFAKSGDLSYASVLHLNWRTLNPESPISALQTNISGAFPASLSFVAFNGDIAGPRLLDAITTFPSSAATVAMLANGSLRSVGFYGSDLDPSSVITPETSFERALDFNFRQIDGRVGLRPTGNQPRIASRDTAEGFVFDLQALEGSFVSDGSASSLVLTGPSQLRVGVDIVGPRLQLQNLKPDDVSVVRADKGDIRDPQAIAIGGPGRLILQAGRNIDLGTAASQGATGNIGGLVATGNNANPQLPAQSARITLVAGVTGPIDLARMDTAYAEIIKLNSASGDIIDLYRQLGTERDASVVLDAANVAALALRDPVYARFVSLDAKAPRALATYQGVLRAGTLPLGLTPESAAAADLYRLLNTETDVVRLQAAGSVAALAAAAGGAAYGNYVSLDQRYPLLFKDYLQRRSKGALPTGVTPIVFSNALAAVVAQVVAPSAIASGDIASYQTSIQTYGGSDIDLWAPGGDIVAGLTTPGTRTVGVLTNNGGAIRSVLSGDFNINQGKVITAQGGDILMFSSQGSIDAGRGAKTSLSTPPPQRRPILDADGNQIGVQIVIPASATGSGIQSLTSDPDGLGPLAAPRPGDVYLFAPAGTIDAGEAGIRSSGNIVINAQTVLNASNISVSGSSVGVPVAVAGSLASSLASGGTANTSKAAEDAAASASNAARAAAAADGLQKPTILTVEVLGFGDKNCKEQQKDCFAK